MIRFAVIALLFLAFEMPASAAAPTKVFVASTGDDANDGSRSSPKRSFQAAHDAVATDGNIVVLDTAGYGPLTITKGVAVTVPPGVNAFITAGSSNGISITAGANATVALQGLIIEGSSVPSYSGILISSAKSVTVDDSLIRNFGEGITSISTTAVRIELHRLAIRRVYNGVAFVTDTPAGFDAKLVNVAVSDALLNAFYGFSRNGTSVPSELYIAQSEAVNSGNAVQVGALVTGVVDESKLTSNTTVYAKKNNAGTIFTRGNNTLFNNGSIGVTPLTLAAQ